MSRTCHRLAVAAIAATGALVLALSAPAQAYSGPAARGHRAAPSSAAAVAGARLPKAPQLLPALGCARYTSKSGTFYRGLPYWQYECFLEDGTQGATVLFFKTGGLTVYWSLLTNPTTEEIVRGANWVMLRGNAPVLSPSLVHRALAMDVYWFQPGDYLD